MNGNLIEPRSSVPPKNSGLHDTTPSDQGGHSPRGKRHDPGKLAVVWASISINGVSILCSPMKCQIRRQKNAKRNRPKYKQFIHDRKYRTGQALWKSKQIVTGPGALPLHIYNHQFGDHHRNSSILPRVSPALQTKRCRIPSFPPLHRPRAGSAQRSAVRRSILPPRPINHHEPTRYGHEELDSTNTGSEPCEF